MKQQHRLPLALLLYVVGAIVLFPFFIQVLNYDDIGYLPVVRRIAAGDLRNGINGYWSPLQCWLAAPLYKAGLSEAAAFRIIGLMSGAGVLVMIHRLLRKVDISIRQRTAVLFTCIPIILSFVYYTESPDVLFCLPLLMYIDVITDSDFFENRTKNALCGILGCLSYFAKTYGFPFFLVHFTLVQVTWYLNTANTNRMRILARNLVLGFFIFLLMAAPWMYALYNKYHMITYGYSGRLNYLWKLHAPANNTAPLTAVSPAPMNTFWEDPFFNPHTYTPYASYFTGAVLREQLHIVLVNINKTLTALVTLSLLSGGIILGLGIYALKTGKMLYKLIVLTIILLPLGYLPVATETRYLFLVDFLLIITGPLLLSKAIQAAGIPRKLQLFCWCLFFGSFLFHPLNMLKNYKGMDSYLFAFVDELKTKGVQGRFAANSFGDYGEISRITFLANDTLYRYNREPANWEETLTACRVAGIDYYFFIYYYPTDADAFKKTILYKSALQEIHTTNGGMIILKLK